MTCFVCNLPIMSHQVGLVWQGGNGVDDLLREQMEMVSQRKDNSNSVTDSKLRSKYSKLKGSVFGPYLLLKTSKNENAKKCHNNSDNPLTSRRTDGVKMLLKTVVGSTKTSILRYFNFFDIFRTFFNGQIMIKTA